MPLTPLQSSILALLARHRSAESFLAGGTPINREGPRYSADIDIFHDREERVAAAADADVKILEAAGFGIEWQRRQPALIAVVVRRGGESTRLEWLADSDFRYFPPIPDPEFGFVLHVADLAVNKIMAAAGRREARDVVDLLTLHERSLSIGATAWAAVSVAPGFTPEGLLAEVRRNARHPEADFRQLATDKPIDAADVARRLAAALDRAEEFVQAMPCDRAGRLFLSNSGPIEPDPARLAEYVEHFPARHGHWPTSPEITAAMVAHHLAKDPHDPSP